MGSSWICPGSLFSKRFNGHLFVTVSGTGKAMIFKFWRTFIRSITATIKPINSLGKVAVIGVVRVSRIFQGIPCSKKGSHQTFGNNFLKSQPISTGASPRGELGWTCPPHFCQRSFLRLMQIRWVFIGRKGGSFMVWSLSRHSIQISCCLTVRVQWFPVNVWVYSLSLFIFSATSHTVYC